MSLDDVRHAYVEEFGEVLDTLYAAENVLPLLNGLYARVENDGAIDLEYWGRDSTVEQEYGEISAFIEERPLYLRERLEEFYDDSDLPAEHGD